MAVNEARYEFRIWGEPLDDVRGRLDQLAKPASPENSRETYIVSDATDGTNAKIRAGQIDLKLLVRVERRLEQWRPILKAAFPLDASLISTDIFTLLRAEVPPLGKSSYDAEAFIGELVRPNPRLAAVDVSKRRWRFALDACAAEFVEVTIEGGQTSGGITRLHSAAIESASASSVIAAIGRLGIGARANISYVRRIKSVLGRPSGG